MRAESRMPSTWGSPVGVPRGSFFLEEDNDMSLKDTAITEALQELHDRFAPMNVGTPEPGYCRLTSRRGLCNRQRLDFISEHTCPICHQGLHQNTMVGNTAELFKRSYDAKLALENGAAARRAAASEPTPVLGPGVTGSAPVIVPAAG
jgi:hypothetical protein